MKKIVFILFLLFIIVSCNEKVEQLVQYEEVQSDSFKLLYQNTKTHLKSSIKKIYPIRMLSENEFPEKFKNDSLKLGYTYTVELPNRSRLVFTEYSFDYNYLHRYALEATFGEFLYPENRDNCNYWDISIAHNKCLVLTIRDTTNLSVEFLSKIEELNKIWRDQITTL